MEKIEEPYRGLIVSASLEETLDDRYFQGIAEITNSELQGEKVLVNCSGSLENLNPEITVRIDTINKAKLPENYNGEHIGFFVSDYALAKAYPSREAVLMGFWNGEAMPTLKDVLKHYYPGFVLRALFYTTAERAGYRGFRNDFVLPYNLYGSKPPTLELNRSSHSIQGLKEAVSGYVRRLSQREDKELPRIVIIDTSVPVEAVKEIQDAVRGDGYKTIKMTPIVLEQVT